MTNIKNIGKELMGKSLNSFHRKTGLTQLEKNNEMQDGILNGILSQVDDAYIEKTEQSNVIHLDGSGDGVVVLDSIEGNTMVNLFGTITTSDILTNYGNYNGFHLTVNAPNSWATAHFKNLIKKTDTTYTYVVYVDDLVGNAQLRSHLNTTSSNFNSVSLQKGLNMFTFRTDVGVDGDFYMDYIGYAPKDCLEGNYIKVRYIILLEGDWTNKEIPQYFKGLQSSFEEKVNDEGKYKIEILMNNKNLFNMNNVVLNRLDSNITATKENNSIRIKNINNTGYGTEILRIFLKKGTYSISANINDIKGSSIGFRAFVNNDYGKTERDLTFNVNYDQEVKLFYYLGMPSRVESETVLTNIQLEKGDKTQYKPCKQNKIKLLINEPLRAIGDIKDKLCVKDGKLMIERNLSSTILKDIDSFVLNASGNTPSILYCKFILNNKIVSNNGKEVQPIICNKYATVSYDRRFETDTEGIYDVAHNNSVYVKLLKSKVSSTTDINVLNEYFKNNPTYVVYKSATTYEEVLNEYGEPILLEGYENGTLYVDSIIVPTTTVRYTPKMESFKAIKEVKDNNIMLTSDINDAIIPYMLEVDMMILEKEMALMSHKNIRKIGEKDMTSMQKRTYDMLARLIKGKTLTVDDCKTRVTVYLNADKITDGQAEELMLLIDEVYA